MRGKCGIVLPFSNGRDCSEELDLHRITIRSWIRTGEIQAVRRVGTEARIPRSAIERLIVQADSRLLVHYLWVSGHDQQQDLDRQIKRLQVWAPASRAGKEVLLLSD